MQETLRECPGARGDENERGERALRDIDEIKKQRGLPIKRKETAEQLVARYAAEVCAIHADGRAQVEVLLLLEAREGPLRHADDTIRKAINRIVPDWRKKPEIAPARDITHPRRGPFADRSHEGAERW